MKNVADTSFDEGKIEIAVQVKKKGMDKHLIVEITGLSPEKIEKIQPDD
ncbi:MAG: hypothetical protein HUU01_21845 [Saprospiraceae bacterium]|nr:hypothetical protein [Saprospiraceae bacterium]